MSTKSDCIFTTIPGIGVIGIVVAAILLFGVHDSPKRKEAVAAMGFTR